MANSRRFTKLIVPLLRQSRRKKYYKDKITAMIKNQCQLMSMSMQGIAWDIEKKTFSFPKWYQSCNNFQSRYPSLHLSFLKLS